MQAMWIKLLTPFLLCCLLSSCSKEIALTPENSQEYKSWFADPDNGFLKTRQLGNLTMKAQYRPAELMMIDEIKAAKINDMTLRDSVKATYGNSKYFILEITYTENAGIDQDMLKKVVGSYDEYSEKVAQLAFDAGHMMKLSVNGKEYAPSLYHHERSYELAKKTVFLVAFPAEEDPDELTLIWGDEIFNTGINRFKFTDINKKLPEIPEFK